MATAEEVRVRKSTLATIFASLLLVLVTYVGV